MTPLYMERTGEIQLVMRKKIYAKIYMENPKNINIMPFLMQPYWVEPNIRADIISQISYSIDPNFKSQKKIELLTLDHKELQ